LEGSIVFSGNDSSIKGEVVTMKASVDILIDGVNVTVNAPLDIEVARDCHVGSFQLLTGSRLLTNSKRIQFTGGSMNLGLNTILSAGESSIDMIDACGATILGMNEVPYQEISISLNMTDLLALHAKNITINSDIITITGFVQGDDLPFVDDALIFSAREIQIENSYTCARTTMSANFISVKGNATATSGELTLAFDNLTVFEDVHLFAKGDVSLLPLTNDTMSFARYHMPSAVVSQDGNVLMMSALIDLRPSENYGTYVIAARNGS
jgi:hypothetical protein